MRTKFLSPYWLPVWFFATVISIGTIALYYFPAHPGGNITLIDALFTATSAMCVTGLAVVDTGTFFSYFGQNTILILMQLGGVGIMTFTTLIIYLLGKHVSLNDRMAVGQSLLHDPSFSLAKFVTRIIIGTLLIEILGACCLYALDPNGFTPYSAIFHSISAFCNAGFSLYQDSISNWSDNFGVNIVFVILITAGGLGFLVLHEGTTLIHDLFTDFDSVRKRPVLLSWHSKIVLQTSLFLVITGTLVIFFADSVAQTSFYSFKERILTALFQSVTCRTAGFNTVDIGAMPNVSLFFMMGLMIIGGSPGSCAGGIKTTTFRAMCSFLVAQFRGHEQVRIGRFALSQHSLNQTIALLAITFVLIIAGTMLLTMFAAGSGSAIIARKYFMINMFEVVSAFGTAGLSTGLTPLLDPGSKLVLIVLMFIGRIGPVWLLFALQGWHTELRYRLPTADLPMG